MPHFYFAVSYGFALSAISAATATATATVVAVVSAAAYEEEDKNENPSAISAKTVVVTHIKTSFLSYITYYAKKEIFVTAKKF